MRNEPTKLTENGVAGGKRITHGILANKRGIKSEQQVSVLVFRLGSSGRGVGSGDGGVGVGVGRGGGRTGVGTHDDLKPLSWIALPEIEDWMLALILAFPSWHRNKIQH